LFKNVRTIPDDDIKRRGSVQALSGAAFAVAVNHMQSPDRFELVRVGGAIALPEILRDLGADPNAIKRREAAMRAVEKELESRMARVQGDWTMYQALKSLNDGEGRKGGSEPLDGLMADVDPALRQEILNIAQ
jgi:hypothetical protein